jgi:hypothetical protein
LATHSGPILDYGRPAQQRTLVREFASRKAVAVAVSAIGFGFAHVFGKPGNGLAFLGMLFMLGGALWYAILRVRQRTAMRWWAKAQLIAAMILCLLGVAAVMLVASRVTEGSRPDSLEYWRNSNQTYHADSRVALRQAYLIVIGIGWFTLVVVAHRVSRLAAVSRFLRKQ